MKRKGFTLIELMIVIAIIAIIAAIAIPGLLAAQRASNERNASASLKTITTAQADFRSNDRDGNLVADFWTGDVFALYGLKPITGGNTAAPADDAIITDAIKLIEPSVAGADGLSNLGAYGNVTIVGSIQIGSPKAGYVYRALSLGEITAGTTENLNNAATNDTDGGAFYGNVHHRNRFGVIALPETLSAGKLIYIVNEDNTIWKYNLPATYVCTYTPITAAGADSTTVVVGSNQVMFDVAGAGTGTFPASPGAVGCSKMD
jgi:prepilin-type N-terminal cleavage/methylation domain-containing protein